MINVRKANIKDVDILIRLWIRFMKVHDAAVLKRNPQLRPHTRLSNNAILIFRKFISTQIRSKNALVSIAQAGDKPVGYALTFIKKNIPVFDMDRLGYISDMYVAPEYQGKGVSSRLKDEAFKWLREKKMKYVSLVVYADNEHAHEVYKNWGFFDQSIEMRREI